MFPHFGMNFSLLCNRFLIYKMRILPWKSTGQKSRKWRMRSRSSWRRSAGWRILWRRPRRTPPTSPVMKLVSGPGALRRRIVLHVGCTGGYLSQNEIIVFWNCLLSYWNTSSWYDINNNNKISHGTMFTWQFISSIKEKEMNISFVY